MCPRSGVHFWTLIVNEGDGSKTSFVGFSPKVTFTFSDLLGKNAVADLFDTINLQQPVLFISAGDISMGSADLPANVKAPIGHLYEKPDRFTFNITQGLSLIASLDLGSKGPIKSALDFLGAKSSIVQLKGEMDIAIMDSMINMLGAPPSPNLELSAALPTFRPTIGGKMTLPVDLQATFRASYFKGGQWLGLDGKTKFKIGSQSMDVTLAQTFHLPTTPGAVAHSKTAVTMFDEKPYEKAFGLKWLTIKNYSMLFKLKPDSSVYVEFGGDTVFGSKSINFVGGAGFSLKTAGMPVPSLLQFGIDDGPDKVASLALRDILSVYNEKAKSTGNPALVPLDAVPDVAIAGTGKGEANGPKIKLVFEQSGDDGFELQGKFRVLGTDIATVQKAFAKANSGVEIRADVTKLEVGPIVFPNGAAEIVVLLDRASGTVPTPRVLVRSSGLSLFGSKQELDLQLYLTKADLSATLDFGSLFKFKFAAFAGHQKLVTLRDLKDAKYSLQASLSSDPVGWLSTDGRAEVEKHFKLLDYGQAAALKALDDAEVALQVLDTQIASMRVTVGRERKSAIDALTAAEAEVK